MPHPEYLGPLWTINGFYMAMRDCYTKPGSVIHFFDVEWDASALSWADFRKNVLGATDPEASKPGSMRAMIKEQWSTLGLAGPPTIRDNGVHGSASPFEAMAERANWLESDFAEDPFSKALAACGIAPEVQKQWLGDCQVPFEGKNQSLFDLLEDLNVEDCMAKGCRIAGAGAVTDEAKAACSKNRAFIFVKPHACVEGEPTQALVRQKCSEVGLTILNEGQVGHQAMDEKQLVDKHYGAIAAKASLMKPSELNPSKDARERFGMMFGLPWDQALERGQVLNAVDACKSLDIDGSSMSMLWDTAKTAGEFIKFGGGFYCARLR
eukprot:gnl/TRDRNA2_/TRDRNA2_133619_c1_seq1.p1 gnl/TRDRNA2_/TRDRNA2_133619_c1~~gnl/TRDRNA2_/TRDRNA2_133619_c1_seq1.p1  ORF type:complete len:336 (-),score=80.70 gnl/TRDRNA2_/TRDRNA2_133619_c1_seq1:98-1066(-)